MSEDIRDGGGYGEFLEFGSEPAADETFDKEWRELEIALGNVLVQLDEPGQWLALELPGATPGHGPGAPWALFFPPGKDEAVSGLLPANSDLLEEHRLTIQDFAALTQLGWHQGPGATWLIERHASDADDIAEAAIGALRTVFGAPHPQLLTYLSHGLPEGCDERLGLHRKGDVPTEPVEQAGELVRPVVHVKNPEELRAAALALITEKLGEEPDVDDDGDILVPLAGQLVYVEVLDQPAIRIHAPVVHRVRSERQTLVELGLMNRRSVWTRWELRGDEVWQEVSVLAWPFAPDHLDLLLDTFERQLENFRDDLVLRTRGESVA